MKKLRNMRKSDLIYDRLADRISMMADGDPFPSVRELMTEFEASQFSVLPAVKKLQKQGFLKSYIGRGSFVCRRARERQAKLVLLTSDWPSYGNAEFDRLFLAEAGRRNHRVRVVHYPFASDVYSMLDEIRGADAILLEPLRIDSFTAEQLRSILQAPAPVIVCRAEIPINGIRYVAGNAMMAGSVTANYLHSMGHRRIAFYLIHDNMLETEQQRFFGYCNALIRHSIPLNYNYIIRCNVDIRHRHVLAAQQNQVNVVMDVINQAVEKLLALEERPTVICCINDESAFMMIRALNEHGVRVPQDISVAGFDNLVTAATHTPSLTTVQQNFLAIGKNAVQNMLYMLENKTILNTVTDTKIFLRDSTAAI